ncbi:MAG: twitching motility protein PilT [Verrucomicrobia bacterium]|nr:MAG: twitching motility protein PilT [Verrucomicrobiota bacterium]PYJ31498.1 MAG: twitching motility protein PilT [Verrucomicrobiota bacterium]
MNRLAQASSKVDRERLLLNTLTLMHESSIDVRPFSVRLSLHGNLDFFLPPRTRRKDITRSLSEKTSVKDVIESCGVPHPEVDLIVVNGEEVDFDYGVINDAEIEVYPPEIQSPQSIKKRLQVNTMERFVTDGHLGKLTRNLRMLGFDVAYDPEAEDRQLLDVMDRENRALLTRDRRLLMHAVVRTGYCPRSQDPDEQTVEVIRRFNLLGLIAPFTRCLRCNAPLQEIAKADIIEELEPLTKIYYEQFRRCTGCGQIYWPGSHFPKLQKHLEKIRANVDG